MFSDCFGVVMLKIIKKILKKNYFDIFLSEMHFKK